MGLTRERGFHIVLILKMGSAHAATPPQPGRNSADTAEVGLDPYTTLGLDRGCTTAQVRAAYRLLAKQHHPDMDRDSPDAVLRTQALNAAYEILSNPDRRRAYDQEAVTTRPSTDTLRSRAPGRALAKDVHLDTRELLRGTVMAVRIHDPANAGEEEVYELVVPPETAPGTRFRLARTASSGGGVVSVRIKVRPDARFRARGSDLRCDLRIHPHRATTGGTESVRGAAGDFVRVQIPAGIGADEVLRIPGEGLPKPRGGRGDLLVRIRYRPEIRITRK